MGRDKHRRLDAGSEEEGAEKMPRRVREERRGDLMEFCRGTLVAMVPPLRGRRAEDGAQEKAGHSGRDDGAEQFKNTG